MIVRVVEERDFDAIAAITNPYILETSIHFASEPVSGDELRDHWVEGRDRYPMFVAEVDGVVLGYAKSSSFRARAAYAGTAELGVYVDRRHHRRGIARALYEALIPACRERGFVVLVAGVALPNDASVVLHEGLGFVPVGVFHRVGYKFGQFHDVGFWELAL